MRFWLLMTYQTFIVKWHCSNRCCLFERCCLREYVKPSFQHLNKRNRDYKWKHSLNQVVHFRISYDDIQHFPRPYWNILPFTTNIMKKATCFKPNSPVLNFFWNDNMVQIFSVKTWFQVAKQVLQNKNMVQVSSR